ncbi:CDP-glycerol glycerophosphotransferase family protein [Nocardioides litoris]|uniref:CDP-glycerol glycerophosphotransferase family protein n=1 Tax=Nocardioides litoris TaxID=1926648 RepID=UPI001121F873|nr:CDP-glycerol glycerophosphotransferase family protein [Nocardioides litoris]
MTAVLLPTLLRALRLVLPTRPVAYVVSGSPMEGNALEVVRALEARWAGELRWAGGPSAAYCRAQGLERVEPVGRYARRGLGAWLTAEVVLLTHGAYGLPRRVPRKVTVNLWHGSGMKAMARSLLPDRALGGPAYDLLVTGARVWGDYYADLCDLRPEEVVACGNPRIDAFTRPATGERLAALGVAGPFVVWMPTFRTSTGHRAGAGWSDAGDPAASTALLAQVAADVARACAARGVALVLKPHPLDADRPAVPGAVVVTDAALEAAGVSLYQLLGAARGLLTDASSVWTDFLVRDRPIGFVFPDAEAYRAGRGVHPADVMEWLPGPLVHDAAAIARWLDDVLAAGDADAAVRRRAAERCGLVVPDGSAADALLDRLAADHPRLARSIRPTRSPRPQGRAV